MQVGPDSKHGIGDSMHRAPCVRELADGFAFGSFQEVKEQLTDDQRPEHSRALSSVEGFRQTSRGLEHVFVRRSAEQRT